MARREPWWRQPFLENLAMSGNVTAAAKAVGVGRRQAYAARERSQVFRRQWDEAVAEATDLLEAEARRRALVGYEEPVFYQGQEVSRVRKYSDTLLIFLLKAHRPKKFRENHRHEHTSPDGGPVNIRVVYEDPPPGEAPDTAE